MYFLKNTTFWILIGGLLVVASGCGKPESESAVSGPTFRGDVAPIIYENCSYCHRPGQTAPFELLTYADVSKRARQIAEVVESRYMPPWLPGVGYNHFQNERVLTTGQIETIKKWVAAGTPEGDSLDLTPPPTYSSKWHLGEPDLIVKMSEPFEIPADGPDLYHNFVIPIPNDRVRNVSTMEFRPGNSRVVHHAFFSIDETKESARVDAKEEGPGFGGMHAPSSALVPAGQFFSWQPGKLPMGGADERAWRVGTNSWLVLQLHLQTTGKKESIQSEVGFFFSDQPARDITFKLGLSSYELEIPPGTTNFLAEDAFVLPVDVELLGILPHAHYVAKEMQGVATLPDGSNIWLINIPKWDFNWQGEYWYREPIRLPAGTRVGMRYFYDNSTNNAANPSSPPEPVTYGLQSVNEMAELWMIFRMKSEEDRLAMNLALLPKTALEVITYNNVLLKTEPNNAMAWLRKATGHLSLGQLEQGAEDLLRALQIDSQLDEAHYYLGLIAFQRGVLELALEEFGKATALNPDNYMAHGYRGLVYLRQDDTQNAEISFMEALRANPADTVAKRNLDRIREQAATTKPGSQAQ